MKSWSYGINRHEDHGHVEIVDAPWWLVIIESLAFWIDWQWLHRVPLPDWPQIIRQEGWGDERPLTPQEWMGDVGCVVLYCVSVPLINWVYRHPRWNERHVEVGFERIKELFGEEDAEFFAEHEAA